MSHNYNVKTVECSAAPRSKRMGMVYPATVVAVNPYSRAGQDAVSKCLGLDENGDVFVKPNITPEGNEVPRNLYTFGDLAAGGLAQERGQSGRTLYFLYDVYHSGVNVLRADGTARQAGDALVYDATLTKWVAAPVQGGGGGSAVWGSITGTLANQTDLKAALDGKLSLTGGTLSGTLNVNGADGSESINILGNIYAINGQETAIKLRTSISSAYGTDIVSRYDAAKPFAIVCQGNTILQARYANPYVVALAMGSVLCGVGTTSPSQKLHVAGNILATGDLTTGSDRRWKENIADFGDFRAILTALRAVEWDWKEGHGNGHSAGFVAQEVAEILPYAVRGGEKYGYTLNYNVFHAVWAAALQDMERRLEMIEQKLNIID